MAEPDSGQAARFAYVGTYTRPSPVRGEGSRSAGISLFAVDATTGGLSLVETVPSDNPSFLAIDPSRRFLYAVNEIEGFQGRRGGTVEAFAIDDASGRLAVLNCEGSAGAGPTHIAVNPAGTHVVVANYADTTFAVLPIGEDGHLKPASAKIEQTGSGPNAERQEVPHPHGVAFDPGGHHLATADLGIDKVQVYHLDPTTGQVTPTSEVSTAAGAGPRHLAFHPDGRVLYAINELDATVTAFAYDAATGKIGDELQTVSTVPDDFAGAKSTAEIALHPSGTMLYGSNRGQPDATSPVANSILSYAIDSTSGKLRLIGHASDGLDTPRHFALDPTATWLYACNQQTDTIAQFVIDPRSGELTATGRVASSPTPVCIVFR